MKKVGEEITMTIEEKLTLLEDAFQKFIDGIYDEAKLCKELSVVLSSIHKHKYDVCVSNHNRKEPFYGMRVFPAININSGDNSLGSPLYVDEIQLMLSGASKNGESASFKQCYERWKEQTNWVLEIDDAALSHNEIKLYPKELVAMMLHEIGHVIYSERTLEHIYKAVMDVKVNQSLTIKNRMPLFNFLFYPVIFTACKIRRWMVGKDEINIELFADKTAVKYGYGEYLLSAFEKVIKQFGQSYQDTSNPDTEAKWAADMVTALSARHNMVGKEIYVRAARSSSKYIQNIYRNMMIRLGISNRVRYTGVVTPDLPAIESLFEPNYINENDLYTSLDKVIAIESMYRMADRNAEIAIEAFGKKNRGEHANEMADMEYMLDMVRVDIETLSSKYEKMNVIDRLYNVEQLANEWQEKLFAFPQLSMKYGERLKRIHEAVKELRKMTLEKDITKKEYHVFAQYPEGYEG